MRLEIPHGFWEAEATQRGLGAKSGLRQLSRPNFGTREIPRSPRPTLWSHDFMCRWRFGTAVEVAYDLRLGRATRRRNQREKLVIHEFRGLAILCISTD